MWPSSFLPLLSSSLLIAILSLLSLQSNAVSIEKSQIQSVKDIASNWKVNGKPIWVYSASKSCEQYRGIRCTRDGKIRTLDLRSVGITGTIPKSIGRLVELRSIYLYGNSLSGVLPKSLANLTKLESLYLSSNQLQGNIPNVFGKLKLLKYIWFAGNQFTGDIPSSMSKLSNLIELHLEENYLSGFIPNSFLSLQSTCALYLNDNYFAGTINAKFSKFTILQLSGNCIKYPKGWSLKTETQKSVAKCKAFCNASTSSGPCSGKGKCIVQNKSFKCLCYSGYKLSQNTCKN